MKRYEKILCGVLAAGMITCGFSSCGKNGIEDKFYPYNLEKYIELPEYRGVEAILNRYILTEERIQGEIQSNIYYYAKTVAVTDRGAASGDSITVCYAGYSDGALLDSATERSVTLGGGELPAEIEQALMGHSTGDTVSAVVTYPVDYEEKAELAGKTVEYTIDIDGIFEIKLPKYNDEFAKAYLGYDTVADYESAIRTGLEEYYAELNTDYVISQIWPGIMENTVVLQYPEQELQAFYDEIMTPHREFAEDFDLEFADYTSIYHSMTAEEFEETVRKEAENIVKTEMLCHAIAREENITVTEKDYEERAEDYVALYELESVEELEEEYGKDRILQLILMDKVQEFTASEAKAEE